VYVVVSEINNEVDVVIFVCLVSRETFSAKKKLSMFRTPKNDPIYILRKFGYLFFIQLI
jgi:hypothetical protein